MIRTFARRTPDRGGDLNPPRNKLTQQLTLDRCILMDEGQRPTLIGRNLPPLTGPLPPGLDLPPHSRAPSWPVSRSQVLSHDAFVTLGQHRRVQRPPLT